VSSSAQAINPVQQQISLPGSPFAAQPLGTFDAGVFPRQWGLSPNGKFLI
jgi:hypothetical protein